MGVLRLYRKFYCVSPGVTGSTYTLITPTSLIASTYVAGSGDTISTSLVEANIDIVEESFGVFYANLNPALYSSDVTYDLVFSVKYTPTAPLNKKLSTRFRIMPFNIANKLDYEISDISPIEYEILGTYN